MFLQPQIGRVTIPDFRPGVDKIIFGKAKGLPTAYLLIRSDSYVFLEDDNSNDIVSRMRFNTYGDTVLDFGDNGTIALKGIKTRNAEYSIFFVAI